jgi:hypothetical protein
MAWKYLLLLALLLAQSACSREFAVAALQGFERGATAPQTVCMTRYQSHKGNGAYYASCNTY